MTDRIWVFKIALASSKRVERHLNEIRNRVGRDDNMSGEPEVNVQDVADVQQASDSELRSLWCDHEIPFFLREEATWEYWRRLSEGADTPPEEELLKLFAAETPRSVDSIRALLVRDKLGNDLSRVENYLQHVDDRILARDFRTRVALRAFVCGEIQVDELIALVARERAFWAALEMLTVIDETSASSFVSKRPAHRVVSETIPLMLVRCLG